MIVRLLSIAALTFLLAATAQAAIVVNIDKSSQTMNVIVDGAPRYEWPVSTGRPGFETPSGRYKINRMDVDHESLEYPGA
jgi:lipoprotein-anchoring transpeptidase ErfK/SrfK